MDSVISLMREVERREKAAEEAKQQYDEYSLDILVKVDELKREAQRAKEKNDMHAREVYAQKAALATEMKEVQLRVSSVLNEGDGSLANLDEIRRSLGKRLSSALIKKEAADKQKLENEAIFAYQKSQMEKAVQEAKRLEQEAMENSKLQEFLKERGHVVNMLQEEISCKRLDVDLLKGELEDYQDEKKFKVTDESLKPIVQEPIARQGCEYDILKEVKERLIAIRDELRSNRKEFMVTEESLTPIIQEPLPTQGCECGKCNDILKGVKGTVIATRNNMRSNRTWKGHVTHAKNKTMKKWIEGQIAEAVTEYKQDDLYVYEPYYGF